MPSAGGGVHADEYECLLGTHSGQQGSVGRAPRGRIDSDRWRRSSTCCYRCLGEFRLRNFSFCHPRRDFFYTCQWRWPPCVFIAYRLIVAAYILSWLVVTSVSFGDKIRLPWPVWLTNWSYLLLTCHLVLAAIITVINHDSTPSSHCCASRSIPSSTSERGGSPRSSSGIMDSSDDAPTVTTGSSSEYTVDFDNMHDSLPWYIKLDWFLFAIVSNISFVVTTVYFGALFPYLISVNRAFPLLEDLHLHLVNSLVILLEIAITAIPVRLLHVLYPFIYGAVYVIFSAIYWAVDHNNVLYPGLLDWNSPAKTMVVIVLLVVVFTPLFQLFIFGLYHLRMAIYRRLSCRQ